MSGLLGLASELLFDCGPSYRVSCRCKGSRLTTLLVDGDKLSQARYIEEVLMLHLQIKEDGSCRSELDSMKSLRR